MDSIDEAVLHFYFPADLTDKARRFNWIMPGNLICMICGFNRFKSAGNINCLKQPPALPGIISIQMFISCFGSLAAARSTHDITFLY